MKSLSEKLNESLINEGGALTVMGFHNWDPTLTFVIKNCTIKDVKKLDQFDISYCECKSAKKYIVVAHSDEYPRIYAPKFTSIDAIKKYCWDEWQKNESYIEDDYIDEIDFDELGIGFSYDECSKIKNANDVWEMITDWFENTYIDGDSSTAYALVDMDKGEVVCGGMSVSVFDSMDEFMKEMDDLNN